MSLTLTAAFAHVNAVAQHFMMRPCSVVATVRSSTLERKIAVPATFTTPKQLDAAKDACSKRNLDDAAVTSTSSTAILMAAVLKMGRRSFDLVLKIAVLPPRELVEFRLELNLAAERKDIGALRAKSSQLKWKSHRCTHFWHNKVSSPPRELIDSHAPVACGFSSRKHQKTSHAAILESGKQL